MKSVVLSIFVFLAMTLSGQCLQSGDIVFQSGSGSEFSKAITDATSSSDSLRFDHVGIIDIDPTGVISVIEASPSRGVTVTAFDDFLSSSPTIGGKPGVVVKRVNVVFNPDSVIAKAKSHLGEEYDWWYLPDNGKMYCSELVYESYRDDNGRPLFSSKPMNFRASDGSMPAFWVELFDKLGMDVPEGVEGTNPNDMSKESILSEVKRFF
ncbi:MAG: hypothetical protein J1E38_03725 [Paramuribaculum sp.]|nr:hypothetical protein [Paramuribaculum sp.]